jgi:hypothetical protein
VAVREISAASASNASTPSKLATPPGSTIDRKV